MAEREKMSGVLGLDFHFHWQIRRLDFADVASFLQVLL